MRRRALGRHADPLHVLVGEEQVVRAGFDRHVHAARPRLGGEGDAAPGTDVHDVQPRPGLAGQQQRALDRLDLGDDRTRGEERRARSAPRCSRAESAARDLLALGVHGHRQPEPRRLASCPRTA